MNKKELLELIKLDSERYYNLAKEFYIKYLREEKCNHCKDKLILSGKCVLSCNCYKSSLNEYTKQIRKEWDNKINLLCAMNLATQFHGSGK